MKFKPRKVRFVLAQITPDGETFEYVGGRFANLSDAKAEARRLGLRRWFVERIELAFLEDPIKS